MSRRTIRERNERGMSLFWQNFKGVISLLLRPNEIIWTQDLVDETLHRLDDGFATLTLLENDARVSSANYTIADNIQTLIGHIRSLHHQISSFHNVSMTSTNNASYATGVVRNLESSDPGRPMLNITKEQIECLRSLHFSWEKIASLLQVSVSTLQRRRKAFGISEDLNRQYSEISDDDLDRIYSQLTSAESNSEYRGGFLTPNLGRRRFIGSLRSRGICVQRRRVSECIRRVDPVGTALRWRLVIHRRKYSVPTPNSLWHFDSCHKLIRWKFIIHVCVDGYSRLLIYCKCCNNNKAETVLELFQHGTEVYGVPSRARCDYGMENFQVAQYMLDQRGIGRGSVITGSSVHNCRVERTHRDVYEGVLCFYSRLFEAMETDGILDPLNNLHLYCLHHVYVPRINQSLEEFVNQMNNRPVSTEKKLSPVQLWNVGMLQNINSDNTAFTESEMADYGFDPNGLIPVTDEDYQVHIDPPAYDINSDLLSHMPDPLQNDEHQGQRLYYQSVEILSSLL